jgi:hypothetical protein
MKLLIILVLLATLVSSCGRQENDVFYESTLELSDIRLEAADSLVFFYPDSARIGRIGAVMPWKNYILVEDLRFMRLWVFDQQMNLVRIVGREGRGPGEYNSSCSPIVSDKYLYLLDKNMRRVDKYDSAFQRILDINTPPEFALKGSGLVANNRVVLSATYLGGQKMVPINKKYVQNNKSAFLFDSTWKYTGVSIFPWDELYEDESHSSFNATTSEVCFSQGRSGSFYAQQVGSYKIAHYDSTFNLIKLFGYKSQYRKEPPTNEFISKANTSKSRGSLLFAHSSLYTNIVFDEMHNIVGTYLSNATEESFYKRDNLADKHYLQLYDATSYNCIYDGEIAGILLYVQHGKLVLLTEQSPQRFVMKRYTISRKQHS